MSLEVNPQDIVKLFLQYCKENGLNNTFRTLQEETKVSLNTVDSVDAFHNDISNGRWDIVLKTVSNMKITTSKLMDLFEQIIHELLEVGELETSTLILNETMTSNGLRSEFPERTQRLDHLIKRGVYDPKEIYSDGISKEKRRNMIADRIAQEVIVVPPGRLLTLFGELLKYQVRDGIIKPNVTYDLFTGEIPLVEDDEEAHPTKLDRTIRQGADARAEVLDFSPNGNYLVTGSVDGIIEILDPATGKLRTDLKYQADENFMVHSESVTALTFNRESELLATGSKNGQIKVWRIINGNCLRKIDQVHETPITSLAFGKDGMTIISASTEIKVHGLKSGKQLTHFKGHSSNVTDLALVLNGTKLISSGRDGHIKLWDYKSTECVLVFAPPNSKPGQDQDVYQILPFPFIDKEGTPENFFVVSRNPIIHLMNTNGQVVKSFKGEKVGVNFEAAAISKLGTYLYGYADDGYVYCYDTKTSKLIHSFPVAGRYMMGMRLHPLRNIMVCHNSDGDLFIYKP